MGYLAAMAVMEKLGIGALALQGPEPARPGEVAAAPAKARIVIVATGGTIAGAGADAPAGDSLAPRQARAS